MSELVPVAEQMTDKTLSLADVRVPTITPTWDNAYDPPEFFGNVISYEPFTRSDLEDVIRSEGGKEVLLPDIAVYADDNVVVEAGPYLILRLDDPIEEG